MLDLTVPNGTGEVLQVQPESSDLPLFDNVGFQAVVVVERDFPTLSGELLDFLQSLPGKWDVDVLPYAGGIVNGLCTYCFLCVLFCMCTSDLKSCVFSFTSDDSTKPLYLEAVEERFVRWLYCAGEICSVLNQIQRFRFRNCGYHGS